MLKYTLNSFKVIEALPSEFNEVGRKQDGEIECNAIPLSLTAARFGIFIQSSSFDSSEP